MLRAIIVDDEELSVKRLKRILSESGQIELCHAFLNPLEAYEFVKENPIHIAFLDISMPEINGMRLSSLLLDLDASIDVVFVTAYDDYAVQAFDMSALDYLMKPVTVQRMSKMLDKIRKRYRRGEIEPSMEVLRRDQEILTEQETRIVRMIARGLSNKEIAYHLNIASETVKYHIKNVYRKLEVNNRVKALQRAKDLNILV
ncbi:DNA-binding NarL/FixJ family response regulator [Aneurinibacillus soli]|uniref:Transcriptional regulatory protein YpdB n=1 Tax=Aneurinibacillus soli TaxID=1500254 RepID=A0A0U4WNP1_9BACL|nr:DNA-binding response regulator [Aneurinibacillus soli]PYE61987.1 DNA-binding NarL/FixJ family response regulator [Aneurinibacillus soli]BAU29801.1 Transcriptional regulatory protein YpdB [Aneurinibacillus soli]